MSEPALLFRDVTVRYEAGADPVIAGVSFSVAARERVALVGLNGSGKTTLLLAAVGLVPHEGEIRVAGIPVSRRTVAQVRERIGFLFNLPEDQLLFPRVIEDAAFGLLRRGMAAREAFETARRMLEVLGVASLAETPLHHLSHGQKQRVALAGAIATAPPLLLLDEPSAGLDPPGKRVLAQLLSGLGAAMLVATHDLDFAARLCTRFVMLADGTVALNGTALSPVLNLWQMNEPPIAAP